MKSGIEPSNKNFTFGWLAGMMDLSNALAIHFRRFEDDAQEIKYRFWSGQIENSKSESAFLSHSKPSAYSAPGTDTSAARVGPSIQVLQKNDERFAWALVI